jgi:hypothetical protein
MEALVAILPPFSMVFLKIFPELKPRDEIEKCYLIIQRGKGIF